MEIRWTPAAADDFETIIRYIRDDDPDAAQQLAQRVFDKLERLLAFPSMGRPSDMGEARELVVYPLVIVYRVGSDYIEPIRIWHGAQDRT